MMRDVFLALSVLFIVATCAAGAADVIYLLDGDSCEGMVVEETDEYVILETGSGVSKFNQEDIDYVEMGPVEEGDIEEAEEGLEEEEEVLEEEEEEIEAEEQVESIGEAEEKAQESAEKVSAEEEKEEEPMIIKPKISGSGKYTTY